MITRLNYIRTCEMFAKHVTKYLNVRGHYHKTACLIAQWLAI